MFQTFCRVWTARFNILQCECNIILKPCKREAIKENTFCFNVYFCDLNLFVNFDFFVPNLKRLVNTQIGGLFFKFCTQVGSLAKLP